MFSMAQAFAKAGVVPQDKADRVDQQKENRRKRLNGMAAKINHIEREIPQMEGDYHKAMLSGKSPADLMVLAKKVDDAKAELKSLKSQIVELSAKQ